MNIPDARKWLEETLIAKHSFEATQRSLELLSWVTGLSITYLITHPTTELSLLQENTLTKALYDHLEEHKPLQYIIGSVPFLDATIQVREPLLIPRPETEAWVAKVIASLKKESKKKLTILDLCTGSGCIAIALAQAFPNAQVYAGDTNPEAVQLAQENKQLNHCSNLTIFQSDLFSALPPMSCDIIVSNPPYISHEHYAALDETIVRWEDPQALVADNEGLALIARIIEQAPAWLSKKTITGPQLIIECSEYHYTSVMQLMHEAGFTAQMHTDQADKPRSITGHLTR